MLKFLGENFFSWLVHISKKNIIKSIKIKKVSGIVTYKLFAMSIENIIYRLLKNIYNICISNVLLFGGHIVDMRQSVKFAKANFRLVFYIIMLSSTYYDSRLLSDYIALSLKSNKNHFKILKDFTEILSFYFLRNVLPIKGMQIRVTGKLGGKMRRSKYHYKVGKVEMQTLNNSLSYNLSLSFTKFGVLSVKVWVINGISCL